MKLRAVLSLLLCLGSGFAIASAKDKKATIVRNPAPVPPPKPAEPVDPSLVTYYFGLITKGPNFEAYSLEDRAKIQKLHLDNISRLAGLGKLLVAGPFSDNGEWRGIFIYKCATIEEARALAATDPAVQTGRLKVEIHPWMTEKGTILDPEFPPSAPAK